MRIKHHDIEIPEDNPFANCKLGREPYARVLSQIVNAYADGFVLAINNEWGAGKTTFVKMWQQQLKNEGFQTIYFNAWENDFDSNPLVALMSELEILTNSKNKKDFKKVLEKGAVLISHIVPAVVKSLIEKHIGNIDKIAIDAAENATKASTKILEDEIKEYASKKKTISEFRLELEKFIGRTESNKPLIFIVDELDRCRPTYAVEVLEQIKHFFSVAGIVFVLSIDKKHLASSVRGFYGSEQIDSEEYLRRFIDLEYSIPRPMSKAFIKYLFAYYSFQDFFSRRDRLQFRELQHDSANFSLMTDFLLVKMNATLRQQERIFALTRLILCSFEYNEYSFPHLLFFLVYLKVLRNELFLRIECNELSVQELSDLFFELLSPEERDGIKINLGFVEASLLWFYNNSQGEGKSTELLRHNDDGKPVTHINSKLILEEATLASHFDFIHRQRYHHIRLDYIINRINLTEPLTID